MYVTRKFSAFLKSPSVVKKQADTTINTILSV